MNTFPLVYLAETVKLCQRRSARVGWMVSLLIGIAMPLFLFIQLQAGLVIFGAEAADMLGSDPTRPMIWALYARNLLLVRVFIVLLGAQSMAGEFTERTLREDLLRPVPRYQVVLSKWLAILSWDAISLSITFCTAGILGMAAFGLDGVWLSVLLAHLLNFATDATLVALTLLIAILSRSALATLGGLLMLLIIDLAVGWAMMFVSTGMVVRNPAVIQAASQYPLLLNNALGVWSAVLPHNTLDYRSLGSMLVILVGSLGVSILTFRRLDVP